MGRIGGIPITVAPSWFLSAIIIVALATPIVERLVPGLGRGASMTVAAVLAVVLGISVLAHELGHCAAARSLGLPVREVRLYLVGGASELGRLPASPKEEILVAAAGPGVSALLAGVCGLLVGSTASHTVPWVLLVVTALANGLVAIFNLVPALPLDGGRVLRAAVWGIFHHRRAGTMAAAIGGFVVVIALLVWAWIAVQTRARSGLLEAALVAVMAIFVGVGAAAEWPRRAPDPRRSGSPPGAPSSLPALMTPVVQLPAETTAAAALAVARTRAVALVDADGFTVGIFNPAAGAGIAATQPQAPASLAAAPIRPEIIVMRQDDLHLAATRAARSPSPYVVVVGDDGQPEGIVMRSQLARALGADTAYGARP